MKNFVADTKTCISGLSKVPKRDCVAGACVNVSRSARKISWNKLKQIINE